MRFARSLAVRLTIPVTLITMLSAGSVLSVGQSEFILHAFNGIQGAYPTGNLVADSAGNLYGTASQGGASNRGVVYELVRPVPPKTAWTETLLYSFTGGVDGASPIAEVIFDKAGNLYGTTSQGGAFGNGNVFELSPPDIAGGTWTESVIHAFDPASGDGGSPRAGLAWDNSGNLTGVTSLGGLPHVEACGVNGCGIVFQLSPPSAPGATWTENILHNFNWGQGAYPLTTPIFDANGNLYGSTYEGGLDGHGVIYRLLHPPTPGGVWSYRVLYAFKSGQDGGYPGALTLHGRGVLYGTVMSAGVYGEGVVFKLAPPTIPGGAWIKSVLYTFGTGNGDGASPSGAVVFDSFGNLYGTTQVGGDVCWQGCGTVFQLSPPAMAGQEWTETILHSFSASKTDGGAPSGGLILSKNGVLFGVTQMGGAGYGTVFGVVK